MKFIVDSMLGRLAKWLRLFGYDTVFFRGKSDVELVFESIRQQRIILTRDAGISKKKPIKIIFIESENLTKQIEQLKRVLDLKLHNKNIYSRCIECNSTLEKIDKEKVKSKVSKYTFKTHEKFSYCQDCKKFYWRGSHLKLAKKIIDKLL